MIVELGYGEATQKLQVRELRNVNILNENVSDTLESVVHEVKRALENPIESIRVKEMVDADKSIVVITSDITRPMPTAEVLPLVLEELFEGGASADNITLVFGLGSHRQHTQEEQRKLMGGECWGKIRCFDSSALEFTTVGVTVKGTNVEVPKLIADADLVICLGNIEYHYFAGYSGGAKAVFPGCSRPKPIENNHKMMESDSACAGRLLGNPVREDIEDAASLVGIDFILNVVLDGNKEISRAFAGHPIKAHRKGCDYLDRMYGVEIPEKYDVVIASQGGYPKDANLYQLQKALDNAKHAVKEGGIIILVGECREGFGNKTFEKWFEEAASKEDLLTRIGQNFELGGHKAAAIAKVMQIADVYLVSSIDENKARDAFFVPFQSLQEAFDAAMENTRPDGNVLIMPHGGSTMPKLSN